MGPSAIGTLVAALCCGASAIQATLSIEYIAHASFLIESPGGARVLVDPFASRVWIGYDFPEGLHPDAVVITHPHYDHDAGRFRGSPFPWPEARVFDAPGEFLVDDVRLIGLRGKHADPYGEEFGQRNTICVIETAGRAPNRTHRRQRPTDARQRSRSRRHRHSHVADRCPVSHPGARGGRSPSRDRHGGATTASGTRSSSAGGWNALAVDE